jgi:ATP-binding cassette subfamily F protein 3
VQPGKWVLELSDLGKSYGEKEIFKDVSITVGRGEKIALLGPNGIGKSTLLKCIMKEIDYEGHVAYGHNVKITYFAQNQAEQLDKKKTVYETVDEIAIGEVRKDVRSILGAFLFSGEDVEKQVAVLSGGERTRLALCQLLLSPSNLLILDEPTNHLDIQSKEVLKEALQKYEGTFIVVSHDREFLQGLTNRIWDIENARLKIHHFELKEYLDFKLNNSAEPPPAAAAQISNTKDSVRNLSHVEHRELKKQRQKLENAVRKAEDHISKLEREIEALNMKVVQFDFNDNQEGNELFTEISKKQKDLESAMQEWEEKLTELERFERSSIISSHR